ncbi:MAG: pyruvate formate lyase family protein [Planctomycetota bacterium]
MNHPQRPDSGISELKLAYLEVFTDTHRRFAHAPPAVREAACLRLQVPLQFAPLRRGDVFAGRLNELPLLFSPEDQGLGFCFHPDRLPDWLGERTRGMHADRIGQVERYWHDHRTDNLVRQTYPADLTATLPSDAWTDEPGEAFPLYRLAGFSPDFGRVLRLGLPGLAEEARQVEDAMLRGGLVDAVEVLTGLCRRYAVEAEAIGDGHLSATLDGLCRRPPETLREALQLVWLTVLISGGRNFGRMDDYAGLFLAADLAAGRLDDASAQRLVTALWRCIEERKTTFNGRVIIGGRGRRNPEAADQFARLALQATREAPAPEPQLTLRLDDAQDPALYETALDMIGSGLTYPMLYNDAVNVPAVERAFGVSQDLAERYVPFGCGEYVIEGHSFGSPNGVLNLPAVLRNVVLDAPSQGFADFNALRCAYDRRVERNVAALAEQEALAYDVAAAEGAFLFFTLLDENSMRRGRAMFDGGCAHLGGTLETYGNTNAADGLAAIRRCVYEQKSLTFGRLRSAVRADFVGHGEVRARLVAAPKWGNDDPAVDDLAAEQHRTLCGVTRKHGKRVGLDSYLVVIINNQANTILGRHTGATPDGRPAGRPFANGNNPAGGADRNGITALLRSLARLDPTVHAGAVQNLKLSPDLFSECNCPRTDALLRGYFGLGGTQLMITVVNADDLLDAYEHPERHPNLLVRVGGFSARFVELARDVQREIISRTCHGSLR